MDVDRIRQTALNGNLDAICMLAQAYEFGLGVKRDRAEARKWLHMGAAAGVTQCQLDLGSELDPSSGLCEGPGEPEEAERWYREAIHGGNRDALLSLGRLLVHLERYDEAEVWLRHAVETGSTAAMRRMAMLYEQGKGRPQDLEAAERWYRQAAELGDDQAKKVLRKLARKKR